MTEDSTDKVLNVRQQKALAALLTTSTIRKAAEVSGVPEDTISRWKNKDAAFIRAYRDATMEIARQTSNEMMRAAPHFWSRLLYLSSKARSEAVQLGATTEGLRIIYKAIEIEDLRDELEQLRALVREMNNEPSDL